jgi:hypothetical protein
VLPLPDGTHTPVVPQPCDRYLQYTRRDADLRRRSPSTMIA